MCRYGFPWPIMSKTIILDPHDDQKDIEKYFNYYLQLRVFFSRIAEKYKNDHLKQLPETNIENVFEYISKHIIKTKCTYQCYIKIIRASIKRKTVFLRRNCWELMVNAYNKEIILLHQANMDIQYITNIYNVASYLTSYVCAHDTVLSQTLQLTKHNLNKENESTDIRRKLSKFAKVFSNSIEIGAQENVYNLLSMNVSECSRKSIFINTNR